jgi:uncharacterized membrane protein YkoI
LVLATALLTGGCGNSTGSKNASGPSKPTASRNFNPPETSFARGLGITGGPITSEQARAIAESATSGVASKVEQEDEDGVQVFGVAIQATAGALDVKVRVSDGAVTKIEADDAESGDDEGSDSEND